MHAQQPGFPPGFPPHYSSVHYETSLAALAAPVRAADHNSGVPMRMGWGGEDSSAIDLLLSVGERLEPAVKGKHAKSSQSKKIPPSSDNHTASSNSITKGIAARRGGAGSRGGGKKTGSRGGHQQQQQEPQQSAVYTAELLELLEAGLKADNGFSSGSHSHFFHQPVMQAQGGAATPSGAYVLEADWPQDLPNEVALKKNKPKKAKMPSKTDENAENQNAEQDVNAYVEAIEGVDEGTSKSAAEKVQLLHACIFVRGRSQHMFDCCDPTVCVPTVLSVRILLVLSLIFFSPYGLSEIRAGKIGP